MFWALISPLRKTADPPQLGPNSWIRLLFQRHGASIARHPVAAIILSILTAILFCYPFPFLSHSYPGFPSPPNHVWTSARPFSSTRSPPDIGIKQAWVQGSYMGALNRDVLTEALRIQRILGGTERSCQAFPNEHVEHHGGASHGFRGSEIAESYLERLTVKDYGVGQKSFFHSPLLYWNCSEQLIMSDQDLVDTVNQKSLLHSYANLTVLWGSVFAGKEIIHHRLVAADALVITLFYRIDSDAGDAWDVRADKLVADKSNADKYDVYPGPLDYQASRMYEFRFMPMTTADNILLFVSYGLVVAYCIFTFRRVPTVKSRSGLFLAAMTQLAGSIMASFTIVSILKLPVSHIPREFFPLVVVVVGSENIFRLTSAVIATSPEQPTTVRIANAVGEVGFVSSVAVLTDLSLLYFLGLISVPAVREFCTFAAIALVVDFFLHLTYFLAVLSIDVRRLELQDSLDKANVNEDIDWGNKRGQSPKHLRSRMSDVLFAGPHPLSSRIAGSAILVCFLFILNVHFFENDSPMRLAHSFMDYVKNSPAVSSPVPSPTSLPINIARTPQSWFRLQDQLTGMELIRATKPGSHRILAKVYDPMFFVLKGSTRAKFVSKGWDITNFFDFNEMKSHFRPFVLFAVMITAILTLFMNHLLGGNESFEEEEAEQHSVEKPLLTVSSLEDGHYLDVVRLASSSVGVVASVGLDRKIMLWKLKGRTTPSKEEIVPACDEQVLWPVMAIVLDSYAEWLAIAPRTGPVSIWNVRESSFFKSIQIDLGGKPPSAFFFAPRHEDREFGPRLIAIRENGWMSEIYTKSAYIAHHRIGAGITISSTHGVSTPPLPLKIVSASTQGEIYITAKRGGDWHTYPIAVSTDLSPMNTPNWESTVGGCILPLQTLGMVACSRISSVELVDVLAGNIVKRFSTRPFLPQTLRAFHAQRTTCLHCGCPSVTSFSLAYTERDTGIFKMHTFTSTRIRDLKICLRAERDRRERKCVGFEITKEDTYVLDGVEGWEPTGLNMVAGVRRRRTTNLSSASSSSGSTAYAAPASTSATITRRRRGAPMPKADEDEDEDEWECWTMDCHGATTTVPLRESNGMSVTGGLLVSRAGPVTKIGTRSLAVGLGSTVKILCVGAERWEGDVVEGVGVEVARRGRRRP